jgi:hypothetical protein
MHPLSKDSIERAVIELAKNTKKRYTMQFGHSVAQIVDDSGDIIDCDYRASNIVRRIRSKMTIEDLEELLKE